MRTEEFATPPGDDRSFAGFLSSLPDVLVAADFRSLVSAIANVVIRPTNAGGTGYEITGHHEIMIPLLTWSVVTELERLAAAAQA